MGEKALQKLTNPNVLERRDHITLARHPSFVSGMRWRLAVVENALLGTARSQCRLKIGKGARSFCRSAGHVGSSRGERG